MTPNGASTSSTKLKWIHAIVLDYNINHTERMEYEWHNIVRDTSYENARAIIYSKTKRIK